VEKYGYKLPLECPSIQQEPSPKYPYFRYNKNGAQHRESHINQNLIIPKIQQAQYQPRPHSLQYPLYSCV
jgi:hypothetical protein